MAVEDPSRCIEITTRERVARLPFSPFSLHSSQQRASTNGGTGTTWSTSGWVESTLELLLEANERIVHLNRPAPQQNPPLDAARRIICLPEAELLEERARRRVFLAHLEGDPPVSAARRATLGCGGKRGCNPPPPQRFGDEDLLKLRRVEAPVEVPVSDRVAAGLLAHGCRNRAGADGVHVPLAEARWRSFVEASSAPFEGK